MLSFAKDRETVAGAKSEFRITAYLPEYRANSFDAEAAAALTDLILFSVEPDAGGSIDMSRLRRMPWEKLYALKKDHGVRLILCVGGWGRSSNFAAVAKSDVIRPAFVASAVKTCLHHKLDGLDIDWEHPHDATEEAA
jgi:GH18 family chitinase